MFMAFWVVRSEKHSRVRLFVIVIYLLQDEINNKWRGLLNGTLANGKWETLLILLQQLGADLIMVGWSDCDFVCANESSTRLIRLKRFGKNEMEVLAFRLFTSTHTTASIFFHRIFCTLQLLLLSLLKGISNRMTMKEVRISSNTV